MQNYSSPNRIVWEYFLSLRKLTQSAMDAQNPDLARQAAALAVIMAVTVCEVFLNLWFRIHVEKNGNEGQRELFLKDIKSRVSLDRKLKQWPSQYLAVPLNLISGAGREFILLKALRNSIVHFTSSHNSIKIDNIVIHGLADTTEYDSLSSEQATWALVTSENLVAEIFRLAGVAEKDISHALHTWTGKLPI